MPESVRTGLVIATRTSAELPRTLLSLQRSAVKQLHWLAMLSDDQAGWLETQFRASSVKMLKRTQQYGELVHLSMEPSNQQVATQRSYVLVVVKDSDDRMLSSQLQELMKFVDIIDDVKCLASDGNIKSNTLGMSETSRESCRVWRGWKLMFGFDRT